MRNTQTTRRHEGFTLIELSIVLVIIGLLAGGILVGRDLVSASETRAQITQIEKYNAAANTFKGKYGYLPGDITATSAQQFGFVTRAGTLGRGDGNGLLDPWNYLGNSSDANHPFNGEPDLFWADLGTAKLINESFSSVFDAEPWDPNEAWGFIGLVNLYLFVPKAKICECYVVAYSAAGSNYFNVSGVNVTSGYAVDSNGHIYGLANLSVAKAARIDGKTDDGLPTTGNVTAQYLGNLGPVYSPSGASDTATTCYNTAANAYSVAYQNGNNTNCALSFKFQ